MSGVYLYVCISGVRTGRGCVGESTSAVLGFAGDDVESVLILRLGKRIVGGG